MKGVTQLAIAVGIWLVISLVTFGIGLIALAIWAALVFVGAEARAAKASAMLDRTLMTGEEAIVRTMQHRAFALFKRREIVAITPSRIIAVQRGLLGGFVMRDMQWKDLKDVRLDQNILDSLCGSNLVFEPLTPGVPTVTIDGAPNDPAAQIYARAQFEEQAWEEKRRVRSMEETRAASGGVTIGATGGVPGASDRIVDEIKRAKELLDSGAVSDSEFQEMKAKILGRA